MVVSNAPVSELIFQTPGEVFPHGIDLVDGGTNILPRHVLELYNKCESTEKSLQVIVFYFVEPGEMVTQKGVVYVLIIKNHLPHQNVLQTVFGFEVGDFVKLVGFHEGKGIQLFGERQRFVSSHSTNDLLKF